MRVAPWCVLQAGRVLHDDVLLLVFEHLDTPSLLAARAVCRRWHDVARRRAAWRHRKLASEDRCFRAALRLAPCLSRLELYHRAHSPPLVPDDVKTTVSTVSLTLDSNASKHRAMRDLQLLLSAGALNLTLPLFLEDRHALIQMLETIRNSNLAGLSIRLEAMLDCWDGGNPPDSKPIALRGHNAPSLRRLEYSVLWDFVFYPFPPRCGPDTKSWRPALSALDFILQVHAPTLTSVTLRNVPCDFSLTRLTACANLQELECPPLENMTALLQIGSLKSLHLVMTKRGFLERATVLQAVRDYFKQATGLQHLTFSHHWSDLDLDLLSVLARTRRSRLTSLSTVTFAYFLELGEVRSGSGVNYGNLSALLPSFQNLARVVLSRVGPARQCWPRLLMLLRAISPASMPLLRLLELRGLVVCPDTKDTTESFVQDIWSLLNSNPALHLSGLLVCFECQRNRCLRRLECSRCWVEGGQMEVTRDVVKEFDKIFSCVLGGPWFGLYSHGYEDPCDWHTGRNQWMQLEARHS